MVCGICYAYRLDAQIPDQVCEDSRCAQPFHQTCLYEVGLYEVGLYEVGLYEVGLYEVGFN